MTHAYAVIMAGGSGTRFWPLSRASRPKQLLPLGPGGETLIQATVRRIRRIVAADRIYIATSEPLAEATAAQLPDIPRSHILAEPVGRNTAPCVGWAAAHVYKDDPDAVLAVLPADPHIGDEDAFLRTLGRALDSAVGGRLVTVGVQPTRAETGYGYVEVGAALSEGVHRVERFVEKPDRERAEQFLQSGRFLWNSGMFFFRADAVLREIDAQLPELAALLHDFQAAPADQAGHLIRTRYGSLPKISIDHGVMEKASDVAVVPGSFGWADIGSWTSAWELAEKDGAGNALPRHAIAIDSTGCYAQAPSDKVVALVGVHDLVVVDTADALLVMPRERAQDVRAIVETLRERDDEEHL